ncbi:MAG: GntR family transcriptional regulator [Anaerolineaceae bacterium]|nr:GntR family transcriptional regulator [Anaerolineaceae bacterium]
MTESNHPFQRLQSALAVLIAETPPGTRLPSEPDLARQMGVSRATLREAMRTYEGQGLIRRRQGVGTFIVGHTQVIESGLEVLESIETMASKIHLNVSMGDFQVTMIQADEAEVSEMGVGQGAELVQVARVIQAENRPVAYLVDILPNDVMTPDELQTGFTGSVLDLLLKHETLVLANSRTEIRAVAAPADIARALQIQRGDVLLQFIAYLYTTTGRVIDFSYSYFLPGYFRFHVVRSIGAFPTLAYRPVEAEPKTTE